MYCGDKVKPKVGIVIYLEVIERGMVKDCDDIVYSCSGKVSTHGIVRSMCYLTE